MFSGSSMFSSSGKQPRFTISIIDFEKNKIKMIFSKKNGDGVVSIASNDQLDYFIEFKSDGFFLSKLQ